MHNRLYRFGSISVVIAQPNQSIPLNVIMDPAPPAGLFSYGVRIVDESRQITFAANAIIVPPPLDFNGVFGAGAFKESSASSIAVKGTVNTAGPDVKPYSLPLIATFSSPQFISEGSSTRLTLEFFRTLGSTETLFVDGLGNDLDSQIVFGSTTITVVPEPSTVALLSVGLFALHAWSCGRKSL